MNRTKLVLVLLIVGLILALPALVVGLMRSDLLSSVIAGAAVAVLLGLIVVLKRQQRSL